MDTVGSELIHRLHSYLQALGASANGHVLKLLIREALVGQSAYCLNCTCSNFALEGLQASERSTSEVLVRGSALSLVLLQGLRWPSYSNPGNQGPTAPE